MVTKKIFIKILIVIFVLAVGLHFGMSEALAGASIKTDPASVAMNPKAMATMKIIGAGFGAEDRVQIVLVKANKGQDVPVGSADADKQGNFTTRMNILSILQGFFNFRFKGGKPLPDPKNPPCPPGKYTVKATSWDSNAVATYELEIIPPPKKK